MADAPPIHVTVDGPNVVRAREVAELMLSMAMGHLPQPLTHDERLRMLTYADAAEQFLAALDGKP